MLKSLLQKLAVRVFVFLLLSASVMTSACGASVFLVSSSDWASYKVDSTWSSAGQQQPPADLVNVNQTVWRLQMQDVSEGYVRLSVTKNLWNGTVIDVFQGSVWTGSGNLSLWLVGQNLGVGDPVYEGSELKVNSTLSQEFAGVNRPVVYAWFARYEEGGALLREHSFFWDRETGIFCGSLDTYKLIDGQGGVTAISMTRSNIVETSLWAPEEGFDFAAYAWWFFGFAVIMFFMSVFVVFYRRMLRRRRLRQKSYVRKK